MRVLPSLAAPPPPVGTHLEVGTTCPDGEAAAQAGVASRATARSSRRDARGEHRSALDASGGRSFFGGRRRTVPEARAVSLPQVGRPVDVEQIKNGGKGETA